MLQFTYNYIRTQFEAVLAEGYQSISCADYIAYKKLGRLDKILVNRVDIDQSVKKAERLISIFKELKVRATFFLRLHAPEYNPFSFQNYKIIKSIVDSGYELGYHSEIVDQAAIWKEDAGACLLRDIEIINRMFGIKIKGIASHRGPTGFNNLDFWKNSNKTPRDFDLEYEGYDNQPSFNLFHESFYISDSEWTQWKCYNKGVLVKDDLRSLSEHAIDGHRILYSLIHTDTYFNDHFYEGER